MLDQSFGAQIHDALDTFLAEQIDLERISRSVILGPLERRQFARDFTRTAHALAESILRTVGHRDDLWIEACRLVRQHPAHREYLLQSDFIHQALTKPYGYAGDRDLMLMIYNNEDRGTSDYAMLCNTVYQSLPAAEAVRQRVRGMERILTQLPKDSRVLSLACGPAWELQQVPEDVRAGLHVDLLDHDPATIAYTRAHLAGASCRHVVCNAFDIIKGRTQFAEHWSGKAAGDFVLEHGRYDLIYSTGLYDYVGSYPMNPSRGVTGLTARLFDMIRPGGRLIVGNFLTPGEANPHKRSHQFMMEAYSDWKLIYRSREEVAAFADMIPIGTFKATLLDETISRAAGPNSVLGFLEIEKL